MLEHGPLDALVVLAPGLRVADRRQDAIPVTADLLQQLHQASHTALGGARCLRQADSLLLLTDSLGDRLCNHVLHQRLAEQVVLATGRTTLEHTTQRGRGGGNVGGGT